LNKDLLRISVTSLSGLEIAKIQCDRASSAKEVKQKVKMASGIPYSRQTLILGGEAISNETSLSEILQPSLVDATLQCIVDPGIRVHYWRFFLVMCIIGDS